MNTTCTRLRRFFVLAAVHRVRRVAAPLAALLAASAAQADWPQFRGPTGDGYVNKTGAATGLPLDWSETNHVTWKTALPEKGWSSPVVMENQVWLTTATPDGHDFFVICADAKTGKLLLNEKLFHCDKPEPLGNSVNAYATPTPAVEAGRVYVHFGSYGTACLDAQTRKVLWKRDDLPCRHYRGPASSAILFENFLILSMDGADVQYLAALDKVTGKTVWKTPRSVAWNDEHIAEQMVKDGDRRKAHSTPLVVTHNGKPLLLSAGAKAAYAYDPRDGRELWRVRYEAWSAAPMPVCDARMVYFITGLGKTELFAVRQDGQGDVTDTHIAWKTEAMVAKTASPILVDGLFYMVSDDGMVTCLEAATGARVWRERLGGQYAASPVLADGRLYFFNQQGKTTILKPGRAFEPVSTNRLDAGFMASPAVSDRAFILRTKTHLYRVEDAPARPN